MDFRKLARPEILAMKPYESARSGAPSDGILLNANEAPFALTEGAAAGGLQWNRYPPPQPPELRARLADLYGVDETQLLVTRGSDEGIDLLVRVFCRPGLDAIVECPPCFGMYRVAAQIQGATVVGVERDPASLRIRDSALEQAIRESGAVRLVFLTSPNNPTGDLVDDATLERALRAAGGRALVVLDEAYIEFCRQPSAARLIGRHANLVVLRTLSKAWASAGLRCGAVIAKPALIELLKRVMAPYPLCAPAIAGALAATGDEAKSRQGDMLRMLSAGKKRLLDFLADQPWVRATWPGKANFVLLRADDGAALTRHCAERGVRIRDFGGQPILSECVRLTIGSEPDMDALIRVLAEYGGAK